MALDKDIEEKLTEIREADKKIIADFQAENERNLKGYTTDAAFAEYKASLQKRFDEVSDELAKLKTPQLKALDADGQSQEMKSFHDWCEQSKQIGLRAIRGEFNLPPEKKALTIADSTHAGVLAPYEYSNEIVKSISLYHPLRQLATIRQTDAYAVEIPTETAIGVATYVAEIGEKTETTGLLYALTEIKTFEMKILYKATQKMLEDSQFNLEAEIADAATRAFGTLEGTSFYSGNGTTAPEGIITNTAVLADAKDVATDNTLAFDDLIKVQYLLASPYARNAAWVMNRALMGTLFGLKNSTTNAYILQPDAQQGFPPRILGSPVYEWADFPAIASTALGTTPGDGGIVCAYGDFRSGYRIVDRVGLTIQRLVEKYAEYGMIGFLVRMRHGGGVVLPEAIQLLKNQTS